MFEEEQLNYLKTMYEFDSIELFHTGPQADERRYYKAVKGDESYFVKSSKASYEHEFKMAKKAFEKNSQCFAKPVYFHNGETNYFVTKWIEGVGLDDFVENNILTKRQKESLLGDLYKIHQVLSSIKIVHRDLIPRNFMVSNGRLMVIDFYWGVEYENYHEYDYVKDNISIIGLLGEDFSAGTYKWDDSVSLVNIAKYIVGSDKLDGYSAVKKISDSIGKMVIKIDREILYKSIVGHIQANANLLRHNVELSDHNVELERQNKDLQNHINAVNEQNVKLERQVANMQKSLSWRVTKPLRVVRRYVDRERN